MEGHFDHDFSAVRVHTDARAAASALAVNALAYTVGRDVVFGAGEFSPQTSAGEHLLAHELAHVVQQSASAPQLDRLEIDASQKGSGEREAAAAADAVTAGEETPSQPSHLRPIVQRSVGSPAGGCGVCYGTPRAAGTAAHRVIELEFEIMYPLLLPELPLPPSPTDDNGVLDLALPTPTGLAIGEIKPANVAGMLQGDSDMLWYEGVLAAAGLPVVPLTLPPPPGPIIFPNPGLPDCPLQELFVLPPVNGVYMYYCEPDFRDLVGLPECDCRRRRTRRVPVPVPVPVPERERRRVPLPLPLPSPFPAPVPVPPSRPVLEEIYEFIRRVVETGEDAMEAARKFIAEHPEVLAYIAGIMIGAAIVIVVATIIEDILTAGAGILDDPASFAAAAALVRAAMEALQRSGQLAPALP
jgi:Domain of unknown function (DUF4157)